MDILHRDDDLLVLNKAPGVLSQPDGTGDADVVTLAKDKLREEGESDPFIGLTHRLDRPTSGVLVVALSSESARIISRQFRERNVEKEYLAVVEGVLSGAGRWTDYIAKPGRAPRIVPADDPEGKRAVLSWQAVGQAEDRTLLKVQLETGRPHQIRLQCAERGHHILGDIRHGSSIEIDGRNLALHHAMLRLEHPSTHRMETFRAPLPAHWTRVLTPDLQRAVERATA
jgi:tRNA pseudouridine32 synthase/23S rRNA pseudouridine746 synthase/23S rRNA pseudouridine1911/1915/1917 synthase